MLILVLLSKGLWGGRMKIVLKNEIEIAQLVDVLITDDYQLKSEY